MGSSSISSLMTPGISRESRFAQNVIDIVDPRPNLAAQPQPQEELHAASDSF